MRKEGRGEVLLTANECARRIGLSMRALRLYEKHGLISPNRTSKRWRLYGSGEVARLNEIIALKSLGLRLRDIAGLLRGQPTDLTQILTLQRDALAAAKQRAERGLHVLDALQAKLASKNTASIDDLIRLAKETHVAEATENTLAWRRYEQMRPRTEIALDPALYAAFAGGFETEDGTLSIVSCREGRIYYRIVGQSDLELFPETETAFFMKALPVQIIFEQDEHKRVQGLWHHQHGFEDYARKIDLDNVTQLENAVQRRIREQTPHPDGEIVLRQVIDDHVRGEPNLGQMSTALAVLAAEYKDSLKSELDGIGAFKDLTFKGVSEIGLDVYEASFENARFEWGLFLTHRGRVSHLYFRKTP